MKTVSLVLGSGGARGLAHIGVIHRLEENDFRIQSIAGSSIGVLIRGFLPAFDRASEMIELGYRKAGEFLAQARQIKKA